MNSKDSAVQFSLELDNEVRKDIYEYLALGDISYEGEKDNN